MKALIAKSKKRSASGHIRRGTTPANPISTPKTKPMENNTDKPNRVHAPISTVTWKKSVAHFEDRKAAFHAAIDSRPSCGEEAKALWRNIESIDRIFVFGTESYRQALVRATERIEKQLASWKEEDAKNTALLHSVIREAAFLNRPMTPRDEEVE